VTTQPDADFVPTIWPDVRDTRPAADLEGVHRVETQSPMVEPQHQGIYFAPPPPPPPPPTGTFDQPPLVFSYGETPNNVPPPTRHTSTEALADEYDKLRDIGDEVVGLRFRVAAKRKRLRDLRYQTSVKDGHVFDLLRQHALSTEKTFPQSVQRALEEASALRDELGPLETEYDTIEADYNTLEWSYTDKETRFVERLVDSGFVASGTLERRRASTQRDDALLSRLTNDHLDAFNEASSADTIQGEEPFGQLIDILGLERELFDDERLEQRRDHFLNISHSSGTSSAEGTAERLAKARFRSQLLSNMRRVNVWLLDIIEGSSLLKAQLKAKLGIEAEVDEETGWSLTKEALLQEKEANVIPISGATVFGGSKIEYVTASSSQVPYPKESAVENDSISATTPKPIETSSVEHDWSSNDIVIGGHADNAGGQIQIDLPTASSSTENGRDSCPSQIHSRRTSYGDDIIAGVDTTSHYACSCEQRVDPLIPTVVASGPSTAPRQQSTSVPTTAAQHDRDESNFDTPRQPVEPNRPTYEKGDTIRPRKMKEQYLENFVLPPSAFTTEPLETPENQCTAQPSPDRQCAKVLSDSPSLLPSPVITRSEDKHTSASNPFSSGCLIM
jgi:hypothetical protein